MKIRSSMLALMMILALTLLAGCGGGKEVSISLEGNYANAPKLESVTAKAGKKMTAPTAPVREGYNFLGWFKDAGATQEWNFSSEKVTENCTLFAGWDKDTKDSFAVNPQDKDFSTLKTPGSQEAAYSYPLFFRPAVDGINQPYVGDPMPYYEDGTFYLYYLKEGGDSFNHSIYLTTTTDFIHYTEIDEPIIESSRSGGQDAWAGTGNVVKVNDKYYFFYTGHAPNDSYEFMEKIMLAVGDTPYHFEKVENWEMLPPAEIGQKRDFRDPQAYYDAETDTIYMTVTAAQNGVARILKFTLSPDLSQIKYEGILVTDPTASFWNLECSDFFKIGDRWYVTYSGQDDTLWYAYSDSRFGEYSTPVRLEGKLFYAAKQVSDGKNNYMVGWARRSESPSSTQEVSAWGGNMEIQQLVQKADGTLALAPVDRYLTAFDQRRELKIPGTSVMIEAGSRYSYTEVFTAYESFILSGEFRFTGKGEFGLAFDFSKTPDKYKLISIDPEKGLSLSFNEGSVEIAQTAAKLEAGKDYSFTYVQDGSIGIMYIDGEAALTARIYGVSGKSIRLFAENNTVIFSSLREYTMK